MIRRIIKRSAYRVISLMIDKGLGITKKDMQIQAIKMVYSKKFNEALGELELATKLIDKRAKEMKGGE